MPQTINDIIRRTRSLLNEPAYPSAPGSSAGNPAPHFWTDTEITDWVNDCCRDIARRSEDLQHFASLPVVAAQGQSPLPIDMIRIHRVEFTPTSSTQLYPIDIKSRAEADQYIGFNPNIQSSYPFICWMWGTPNSTLTPATLFYYPTFAQTGTVKVWYYRLPQRLTDPVTTNYTQTVDQPEGWDDAVVLYATAMAKQKARDQTWQDHMQMYDQMITYLIDVSRTWSDQARQMTFLSDQYMRWPGRGDVW